MATSSSPSRAKNNVRIFQDRNIFLKSGVKDQLLQKEILAFDTEFSCNRDGIKLSLIQIATEDKSVFIFDVLKRPEIIGELREVLESDTIIKVIHDCVNDSKALWDADLIKMRNVFDTKLVQQILESRGTQIAIRHVKPASLETLCTANGIDIKTNLKRQIKEELKQNQDFFLKRNVDGSIPEQMKEYAAQDVTVLMNLYTKMKRLLDDDMEPLYKRLIRALLYSQLKGVDNRRGYESDKALLHHVATPYLVNHVVSPYIRRNSNGRGYKRKPRKT